MAIYSNITLLALPKHPKPFLESSQANSLNQEKPSTTTRNALLTLYPAVKSRTCWEHCTFILLGSRLPFVFVHTPYDHRTWELRSLFTAPVCLMQIFSPSFLKTSTCYSSLDTPLVILCHFSKHLKNFTTRMTDFLPITLRDVNIHANNQSNFLSYVSYLQ